MHLEEVFNELLKDPFLQKNRLLLGPAIGREAIKDSFLNRHPCIPSWTISSIDDLAHDYLKHFSVETKKALSISSQLDLLESLSQSSKIIESCGVFSTVLKSRTLLKRLNSFLNDLDRTIVTQNDFEAVTEVLIQKNKDLTSLILIWSSFIKTALNEKECWSKADILRKAIEVIRSEESDQEISKEKFFIKKLFLLGFSKELDRCSEVFLEELKRKFEIEIIFLAPSESIEGLKERYSNFIIQKFSFLENENEKKIKLWRPHSFYDELEFLAQSIIDDYSSGLTFDEIGVFVPQNTELKEILIEHLNKKLIPVLDPTLPKSWVNNEHWVYLREFLKCISGTSSVRSGGGKSKVLSTDRILSLVKLSNDNDWIADFVEKVPFGGARALSGFLKKHPRPELQIFLDAFEILGSKKRNALEWKEVFIDLEKKISVPTEIVQEFFESLGDRNQRPFLEGKKFRLHRWLQWFDEFLEQKSRSESFVQKGGITFLSFDQMKGKKLKKSYLLQWKGFEKRQDTVDPLDLGSFSVSKIWSEVEFSAKVKTEDQFLIGALLDCEEIVFSSPYYLFDQTENEKPNYPVDVKKLVEEKEFSGAYSEDFWNTRIRNEEYSLPEFKVENQTFDKTIPEVSVSQFEDYLRCPFRYYLRRKLNTELAYKPELELSAKVKGLLLHEVLEEIIRSSMQDFGLSNALKICDQKLNDFKNWGPIEDPNWISKTKYELRALVERFVNWQKEQFEKFPNLRPHFLEHKIELNWENKIVFKGKIDRLDSDGKNFVLYDYKTGVPSYASKDVADGKSFQLLLYSEAIQKKYALNPASAQYLFLGKKIKNNIGFFIMPFNKSLFNVHARNNGKINDFSEVQEKAHEFWRGAINRFLEGDYSPRPILDKDECKKCSYANLCGYPEYAKMDL